LKAKLEEVRDQRFDCEDGSKRTLESALWDGGEKGVTRMKHLLIVMFVLALCVSAQGGQNPGLKAFIHITPDSAPVLPTDNASIVNEIASPTPVTMYRAYIGLTDVNVGITALTLRMTDVMSECPGVFGAANFTSVLPGGLGIGDIFSATGASFASTSCASGPLVLIGYASLFYIGGGPCGVEVLDAASEARFVVDCVPETPGTDLYCVWLNGSFGGTAPPGDADCTANVPVEDSTWGAIKSLYR
jgi:hypothetical protein